jgi:hypothetical protein
MRQSGETPNEDILMHYWTLGGLDLFPETGSKMPGATLGVNTENEFTTRGWGSLCLKRCYAGNIAARGGLDLSLIDYC